MPETWDSIDYLTSDRLNTIAKLYFKYRPLFLAEEIDRDMTILYAYECEAEISGYIPELTVYYTVHQWIDYQSKPDPSTFISAWGVEKYSLLADGQHRDCRGCYLGWMDYLVHIGETQHGLSLQTDEGRREIMLAVAARIALIHDKVSAYMDMQRLAGLTRLPLPLIQETVRKLRMQ